MAESKDMRERMGSDATSWWAQRGEVLAALQRAEDNDRQAKIEMEKLEGMIVDLKLAIAILSTRVTMYAVAIAAVVSAGFQLASKFIK